MDYYETDPEFMERIEHFAFEEVVKEPGQEPAGRHALSGYPRNTAGLSGDRRLQGCAAESIRWRADTRHG